MKFFLSLLNIPQMELFFSLSPWMKVLIFSGGENSERGAEFSVRPFSGNNSAIYFTAGRRGGGRGGGFASPLLPYLTETL
jgi:hypothetical protein